MATMNVDVVSAEQAVFSTDRATVVSARSLEGEIGILPGHQPALLALDIAPLAIEETDGSEHYIAVHHGFLFVRDDRMMILADLAEHADDIDPDRVHRSLDHLSDARIEHDEQAMNKLRRDRARLEVLRRHDLRSR